MILVPFAGALKKVPRKVHEAHQEDNKTKIFVFFVPFAGALREVSHKVHEAH